MDALLARVGFGCGRLRGGVEESNSRQVLGAALECGIRYFDTAPAYGGGASERILGMGLRGLRDEVELCTKVGLSGSPPDAAAKLRALLLTGARAVLPNSMLERLKQRRRAPPHPAQGSREYGDFDIAAMRSSVDRSLEALDTRYLDCLMLHEPRLSDPAPAAAEWLAGLVVEGTVRRIGVGTYSSLGDLPAFGEVAQCAIDPAVFADEGSRMIVCHGVLRNLDPQSFESCVTATGMFEAVPALEKLASGPHGISALALSAVLIGTDVRRVLISTGSPRRLRDFLSAAREMFGEIQGAPNARIEIGRAAHRYFAEKSEILSSMNGGITP